MKMHLIQRLVAAALQLQYFISVARVRPNEPKIGSKED
jgi:hypothetical protein